MEIIMKFFPLALCYVMFSLGLQSKFSEFSRIFKSPKSLFVGLFSQMIIVPLIGVVFAYFVPAPMNYKIGIVLVTCVPSAVTSSYLVKFIKGNIYLSVVMTAISSLMSFITIPLILTKVAPALGIGSETLASVDFKRLSVFLFLMATIPMLIGSSVASKFHQFTKKVLPFFSKSAFLIFVFFILLAIYTDWDLAIEAFGELGWMLLILICTLLICANIIVNLFSIKKDDSKTIINEVLFQNGAMAIIIGSTIFGLGTGHLFMAAVYGLFQYKVFIAWWLINKKRKLC